MKIFFYIALTAVLLSYAAAQDRTLPGVSATERVRLRGPASDTAVVLGHAFVYPRYVQLAFDSLFTHPLPPESYSFDTARVSVRLSATKLLPPSVDSTVVYIRYRYVPVLFKPLYSQRTLAFKKDSASARAERIMTQKTASMFGDFFGPELQKSGSIVRGFTVGTNRDLTLNSGLRLQFSGKLSSDIDITAALTDENTPIQPQGNTQTLQEFDNIFVEIKSRQYGATLGDFYFNSEKSEFGTISRKLQGAKGTASAEFGSLKAEATVVGASTKGKYHTNQFNGIEGVQGPYRLTGKNNERNLIVIAGTERVYCNGDLMTRGEANDYTIEYGSGEIVFSARRLITSDTRITVDFEYSDRQFTRNFFGITSSVSLSDAAQIRTSYYREGDDPEAPIDISLTDADKNLLAASGRNTATRPGVVFVGADSVTGIGKGQYAAVDTSIDGVSSRIYRYQPATTEALYNIAFSYVGAGTGSYTRERFGEYTFVGPRAGTYDPVIILPSPQLHQLFDLSAMVKPMSALEVSAEAAHSNLDVNRFSSLDDSRNGGNAFKALIRYAPRDIVIAGLSMGSVDFSFQERYIDRDFVSIDRINEIEYARKWNIDSLAVTSGQAEETRQASITFEPRKAMTFGGTYGTYDRGSVFSSTRWSGFGRAMEGKRTLFDYVAEYIASDDRPISLTSRWFRQKGNAEYTVGKFIPSIRFENEEKKDRVALNDSVTATSFSFLEYAPKLAMPEWNGLLLSGEMAWRSENAPIGGRLERQSNAFTQTYEAAYKYGASLKASANVIFRTKEYERAFQEFFSNQKSVLVRLQSRYMPFNGGLDADVFYEASTERTAKLEKIFYKVRKGEGQYVWTDGNKNGVVDLNDERDFTLNRYDGEYILLTLSGDSFYPIINLKTSSRLRITPQKFFKQPSSLRDEILSALSAETYFRIEEKSTEQTISKVYFLTPSSLLNPATTLLGSQQFQQDLFVFENQPDLNLRLRYAQRKSLGQYSTGMENAYNRERSARLRFMLAEQLSGQADFYNREDDAVSAVVTNRSRTIATNGGAIDWSYRPEQNLELGLKFETSASEDVLPKQPVDAAFNSQSVRTTVSFQGKGQARVELAREEIILQNAAADYALPYELTSGRDPGKTYLWNASVEYKLGKNMQLSGQYNGRTVNARPPIHAGKLEVRAYF
ncbi:MAG TPA: hypothetical protein VK470_14710 [Bacteroidota bacterium]|nr:hypothetical protein [Bacteroidota bacterium]